MSPDLVDLVSVCKSAGWLPKICCMDKNFAFGSTDLFKKKKDSNIVNSKQFALLQKVERL